MIRYLPIVVNEVPTNEVEQAGGECISRQPVRVTSRLVATATFGQNKLVIVSSRSSDSGRSISLAHKILRSAYSAAIASAVT